MSVFWSINLTSKAVQSVHVRFIHASRDRLDVLHGLRLTYVFGAIKKLYKKDPQVFSLLYIIMYQMPLLLSFCSGLVSTHRCPEQRSAWLNSMQDPRQA